MLAAVTLIDGCGGSSQSQSQELATFVAQVKTTSETVRACDARFPVANQANTDPSTWPSAAVMWKKYGACLRHIGDRLSAIQAPNAVAHAFTGYANDWRGEARVADEMAHDLLHKNRAAIRNWQRGPMARITQLNRNLIIPFRVALIQYASRLGVTPPPWVKTLGVMERSSTPPD